MPAVRKVLVVEDDNLLRGLIASKLVSEGFWVATAANAQEARTISDDADPDIALLDIDLGAGPSGLDVAAYLAKQFPGIAIIFLTHIPEPKVISRDNKSVSKDAAYLLKDRINDPNVLSEAIEAASRNRSLAHFRDDRDAQHSLSGLSRTQLSVLHLIAMGLTNTEIAERRGTTVRSVELLVNRAIEAAGIELDSKHHKRVALVREYIKIAGLATTDI